MAAAGRTLARGLVSALPLGHAGVSIHAITATRVIRCGLATSPASRCGTPLLLVPATNGFAACNFRTNL